MDSMRDPKLLSEAKKAKLEIAPVTGERVDNIVKGMFKLDKKMVARLKEILVPKL